MDTPSTDKTVVLLSPFGRRWSLSLGIMLVLGAAALVFFPQTKAITTEINADGSEKIKIEKADQGVIATACLTAGVALIFFSVNGLAFSSLSLGTFKFDGAVSTSAVAKEVEALGKTGATKGRQPEEPKQEANFKFGNAAFKVLRTLWFFQNREFPGSTEKRWGFGIRPSADDYLEFRTGVNELIQQRLVIENRQGLVFLTNDGTQFCQQNPQPLIQGPMWMHFAAA